MILIVKNKSTLYTGAMLKWCGVALNYMDRIKHIVISLNSINLFVDRSALFEKPGSKNWSR